MKSMGKKSVGKSSGATESDGSGRYRDVHKTRLSSQSDAARTSFREPDRSAVMTAREVYLYLLLQLHTDVFSQFENTLGDSIAHCVPVGTNKLFMTDGRRTMTITRGYRVIWGRPSVISRDKVL